MIRRSKQRPGFSRGVPDRWWARAVPQLVNLNGLVSADKLLKALLKNQGGRGNVSYSLSPPSTMPWPLRTLALFSAPHLHFSSSRPLPLQ